MINERRTSETAAAPSLWFLAQQIYDLATIVAWICVISLGVFLLFVGIEVGHWPRPYNPHPLDTTIGPFFYQPVTVLTFLTVWTLPVWLIYTVLTLIKSIPIQFQWRRVIAYTVPMGVFFVLNYVGNVLAWLWY